MRKTPRGGVAGRREVSRPSHARRIRGWIAHLGEKRNLRWRSGEPSQSRQRARANRAPHRPRQPSGLCAERWRSEADAPEGNLPIVERCGRTRRHALRKGKHGWGEAVRTLWRQGKGTPHGDGNAARGEARCWGEAVRTRRKIFKNFACIEKRDLVYYTALWDNSLEQEPREPAVRRATSVRMKSSSRRRRNKAAFASSEGGMAERLGYGLQIRLQRFNSASHLHWVISSVG